MIAINDDDNSDRNAAALDDGDRGSDGNFNNPLRNFQQSQRIITVVVISLDLLISKVSCSCWLRLMLMNAALPSLIPSPSHIVNDAVELPSDINMPVHASARNTHERKNRAKWF